MPDDQESNYSSDLPLIIQGSKNTESEAAKNERERKNAYDDLVLELQRRQAEAQESQAAWNARVGIFTIVLVGVTLIGALVNYWQFTATKNSANAALAASIAATQQVRAADESNRLAAINLRSSEKQSKAALDASIAASRTDQRAWVTVESVWLTEDIAAGKTIKASISVRNSGKTPALNVQLGGGVFARPESWSFTPDKTIYNNAPSVGVVGPSVVAREFVQSTEVVPSQDWLKVFTVSGTRIYASGFITYEDIFNDRHRSNFCLFTSANTFTVAGNVFAACAKGNTTN